MLITIFVGDGHLAQGALTSEGYDVCFLLVELSVKYLVWNATKIEQAAEKFRDFHRTCADQHRTSGISHLFYFINYRSVLFALRFVHTVIHVNALDRTVSRNFHNVELVNIPELTSFRDSRTRHTRQLVVHTEVVLQRDGSKSLGSGFYTHVLFCLNSLVKSIAPAASFHDTACRFVDNLNLTILNHIVIIEGEHRISLQELLERVHTVALDSIIGHEFILLSYALFIR